MAPVAATYLCATDVFAGAGNGRVPGSDQAVSATHAYGITSGVDVEFSIDPAKVCCDRVDRDEQISGDRFGGVARGELLQYFLFAAGQERWRRLRRGEQLP